MESRIERLESEVALQERALEKMNDFLGEQQREIVSLEAKVDMLVRKLNEMNEMLAASVVPTADAPPPHYGP